MSTKRKSPKQDSTSAKDPYSLKFSHSKLYLNVYYERTVKARKLCVRLYAKIIGRVIVFINRDTNIRICPLNKYKWENAMLRC